jgi:hypothetical protein
MLRKNRRILIRALAARLGFGGSADGLRGQAEASGALAQPITASVFGRFVLIHTSVRSGLRQLAGSPASDEIRGRLGKLAPLMALNVLPVPGQSQQPPCHSVVALPAR